VAGRPIVNNAIHSAIEDSVICIFNARLICMTMEEEVISDFAAAILEPTEDLRHPRIRCRESVVTRGEA
jgi:hypothetical protein